MGHKYQDLSWDFSTADTKEFTHNFHNYPAMMIPQVARRLIEKYGSKAKIIFDPYCGSGTSLVEANLKGIDALGTDLNPLARLIASAKSTILNFQTLDLYLKDFNDKIFKLRFGIEKLDSVVVPDFKNIDYWFTDEVKKQLAFIKHYIIHIKDKKKYNNFLMLLLVKQYVNLLLPEVESSNYIDKRKNRSKILNHKY